ncbi:MAG: hypothetical protein ACK4RK_00160 [Gemmataceae bacterium]
MPITTNKIAKPKPKTSLPYMISSLTKWSNEVDIRASKTTTGILSAKDARGNHRHCMFAGQEEQRKVEPKRGRDSYLLTESGSWRHLTASEYESRPLFEDESAGSTNQRINFPKRVWFNPRGPLASTPAHLLLSHTQDNVTRRR